jgi:hypothetical protein
MLNYFFKKKQNTLSIQYHTKYNTNFCSHHYIKDIDIFFINDNKIKYVSYYESQDLLRALIETDFEQFEGTEIIIDSVTYTLANFKLPQKEWLEVTLVCDAFSAEL